MLADKLIQSVHDFLDAEVMLEQRRTSGEDTSSERQHLWHTRQALQDSLSAAGADPNCHPLVHQAQEYLNAVGRFEAARESEFVDSSVPERQLEIAQRDLQSVLGQCAKGQAGNPISPVTGSKRILVAVDGSQQAAWATDVAARFALDIGATVCLLHAEPINGMEYTEICYEADRLREGRTQSAEAVLRIARSRFDPRLQVTSLWNDGDPATEIVNTARRLGADYIIMGTHGRGRLARFALGSLAESVIRLAPCPVVTVSHAPPAMASRERSSEPLVVKTG